MRDPPLNRNVIANFLIVRTNWAKVNKMKFMECPYCGKNAWSFWNPRGFLSTKKEKKKCKNCNKPIKFDFATWFQCGGIFLGGIIIPGIFYRLVFKSNTIVPYGNNAIVKNIPTIDFNDLWGFLIVGLWVYLSHELPARYLGKRAFKPTDNSNL